MLFDKSPCKAFVSYNALILETESNRANAKTLYGVFHLCFRLICMHFITASFW